MNINVSIPDYPYLSRLIDKGEMWTLISDFDVLMKACDERIQSAKASTEAVLAAKLMGSFARDHFHLFLVGEYKVREIGRGIRTALDEKNETVLFSLARAFVEHTAALAYQLNALDKAVGEFPKKRTSRCYRKQSPATTR